MNTNEKYWLEQCKKYPDKYRIDVDNDSITVTDLEEEDCVFSFDNYGYDFIVQLLNHIGCNADYV